MTTSTATVTPRATTATTATISLPSTPSAAGALPLPLPRTAGGVVVLVGELDVAATSELLHRVSAAAAGGASPVVVLDASAVSFIDCSGLGALLRAARQVRAGGGRLVLREPSAAVVRLLALTGLDAVFPRSVA